MIASNLFLKANVEEEELLQKQVDSVFFSGHIILSTASTTYCILFQQKQISVCHLFKQKQQN